MFQGFYTGVSGIQTHQYGLDVVADNLSNVSTNGFKASTAEFADIFNKTIYSSGSPTSNDVGYGARLQATSTQFLQGSIVPSDRFSDLAIEGDGWFGVTSNDDNFYTRDGHFLLDANEATQGDANSSFSRLVTSDGKFVSGTMLSNVTYDAGFDYGDFDSNGKSGAYVLNAPANDVPLASAQAQTKIEFPTRLAYPSTPTSSIDFFGNLGVANEPRSISGEAIGPANEHNRINLAFTKSAVQPAVGASWDVVATATSRDGSVVYDTQNGQAVFTNSGGLSSFNIPSINNNGTPVTINLGTSFGGVIASDSIGISGSSKSNGVAGGTLTNYGIDPNGIIVADFSNGRQSAIGRVAIYHFQNDQGLSREGGTYYQQSANSGDPQFFTNPDGTVITGAVIRNHALEASNVRLDVGLTDMIIMQRAYQANAKSITTADEMIQKALQMHR